VQLQREVSELRVCNQKLEGQVQHMANLLEQKTHELLLTQQKREEVEREMGKLLGRLEVLESREKTRVRSCTSLTFSYFINIHCNAPSGLLPSFSLMLPVP
jgi:hypothetical protein